ncbi:hypothetical protein ScPMuIL_008965 [Solemya velum]
MEKVHDTVAWYQKKIGSYDKQLWEQSVEQKVLKGIHQAPRRSVRQKTELIDVDLIRGSTFSKTKPQVSWTYTTFKSVFRVLFFPLYYKWWLQQTSKRFWLFLVFLYVLQVASTVIFFRNVCDTETITQDEVTLSEVVVPVLLMLVLGLIHSQTVLSHISLKPPIRDSKLRDAKSRRKRSVSQLRTAISGSNQQPTSTADSSCSNLPTNPSRSACEKSQDKKHSWKVTRTSSPRTRKSISPLRDKSLPKSCNKKIEGPKFSSSGEDESPKRKTCIGYPGKDRESQDSDIPRDEESHEEKDASEDKESASEEDTHCSKFEILSMDMSCRNTDGIVTKNGIISDLKMPSQVDGEIMLVKNDQLQHENLVPYEGKLDGITVSERRGDFKTNKCFRVPFSGSNSMESMQSQSVDDHKDSGIETKSSTCAVENSNLFQRKDVLDNQTKVSFSVQDTSIKTAESDTSPVNIKINKVVNIEKFDKDPRTIDSPQTLSVLKRRNNAEASCLCRRTRQIPESLSVKNSEQKESTGLSSSEGDTAPNTPDCHHQGTVSSEEWEDRVQSDVTTSTYSSSCDSDSGLLETESKTPAEDELQCQGWTASNLHVINLLQPTSSTTAGHSHTQQPDKVSCMIWEGNECKKVELTAMDIGWAIIEKVDSIPESSDYIWIGLGFSLLIGSIPLIFRAFHAKEMPDLLSLTSLYQLGILCLSNPWRMNLVLINGIIQRLCLSSIFFFLHSVADRTFKQRLLYAKHFSYLTSSRRARKFDMPHFRLNKVRNIKTWLSLRSYLKKRGPQRSVDVIVSSSFLIMIILLILMCIQLLKDTETYLDFLCNWELLVWCFAFGIYLLRFMTLGLKINKKYRNLSVLITEQINLYLQMEQKPHKKEELMVANNVLKLAEDLLKELESPFKISGLSANPFIYNVTKVVVLSAFSAVLTELLGFKLKLYKIKLKA